MNAEERRNVVVGQEGMALQLAANFGTEGGVQRIHCLIDGMANALVRLEGAEAASRYVFALGDRVAGGLREPTDFRALPAPASAEPVPAPKPVPVSPKRGPAYVLGFLHGLIVASVWRL